MEADRREKAATNEKIIERIEEMSKTEEQFERWEKMRKESKMRQRDDRRLNLFWRKTRHSRHRMVEIETPRCTGNADFLDKHQQ